MKHSQIKHFTSQLSKYILNFITCPISEHLIMDLKIELLIDG